MLEDQVLEPEAVAVELLALEEMLILLLLFLVVQEALDLRHGPEIVPYVPVVAAVEAKRVVLLIDRVLMQVQAEVAKEEFKDRQVTRDLKDVLPFPLQVGVLAKLTRVVAEVLVDKLQNLPLMVLNQEIMEVQE